MKFSLKLLEYHRSREQTHQITPPQLRLRAKIPITIFGLPFTSHFSTTTNSRIDEKPSDLSLSLSTNFVPGPSVKLTYGTAEQPLTLSLKSGAGLFGSPNDSPLLISAHFSFNPRSSSPNPTFRLVFKPRLGSFSLRKSTLSHENYQGLKSNSDFSEPNSLGFVPLDGLGNDDVKGSVLGNDEKGSIFDNGDDKGSTFVNSKGSIYKGFNLMADTEMPFLPNKLNLNLRWCLGFGKGDMPLLRINKIAIHKIDSKRGGENDDGKKKEGLVNEDEVEFLKGMFCSMKKEMDVLDRANRDMRLELEEMKKMAGIRVSKLAKKPPIENGGGFDQWRDKRNGVNEDQNCKVDRKKEEEKKNGNSLLIDVENELERAIKAAAFPSPS